MAVISLEAVYRYQVTDHIDPAKKDTSLRMGNCTPVVCLACRNSSDTGDSCTTNHDMDKVRKTEMRVDRRIPIVNICPGFVSNIVIR